MGSGLGTLNGTGGRVWLIAGGAVLIAFFAFGGGLLELVNRWSTQEEYGHSFFIPLIAGWMLWHRRDAILESLGRPSWWGLVLVLVSVLMLLLGELSALFILLHLGFLVALIGLVLAVGGFSLLRITILPIIFLGFAIPLPYFIDSMISWRMQLMSSELGVLFIRLFGIPVFLEGNIIDLGLYKLQVVEACSGLRYLYPLMSLGFMMAYLFKAPLWQRIFLFLSTFPITIFMNSFRIAVIGFLVDLWGTGMAEGFLHFFEGWIIFMACALLMLAEVWVFTRFTGRKGVWDVLKLPRIRSRQPAYGQRGNSRGPLVTAAVAFAFAAVAVFLIGDRQETPPDRERFVSFPHTLAGWESQTIAMDPRIENFLGVDDYIQADFSQPGEVPVNLYVAYYASQRKGVSPHSPRVCIPGGGWLISSLDRVELPVQAAGLTSLPVNRVLIVRNNQRQLVYYWFDQRGRKISNEYLMKWHLLNDSIRMNRTDGALVRLVTPVLAGETIEEAESRIKGFLNLLLPQLSNYIPA